MFGICSQVDQLIGIVFEIMKELGVVIDVADIFVGGGTDSFVSGYAMTDGEVFVEGVCSPVCRFVAENNGFQAPAIETPWRFEASPVEEGGGEVDVEGGKAGNPTLLVPGNTRVGNDHWNLDGFLEVRPLAGEPAICHVVSVVCGVNDDGVVSESGLIKSLEEAPDGIVDSGYHAVVGPHVGLIFLGSVPAPEITLAGDAGLEEVRKVIEDRGVREAGRSNVGVFIKSVGGLRPGEMPDAGATVAVFGVACIEPHVESKRFVLGLAFQEIDSLVHDEVGFVSESAIGKFLEERIPSDDFDFVEVCLLVEFSGRHDVPFAEVAGAVVVLPEEIGIENFESFIANAVTVSRSAVAAGGHAGEDGGPAGPTDRVADKGLLESGATRGESIDVRRFYNGVSIATQGRNRLVISKEKDDVRFFGGSVLL